MPYQELKTKQQQQNKSNLFYYTFNILNVKVTKALIMDSTYGYWWVDIQFHLRFC